jgi:hypothetical protein
MKIMLHVGKNQIKTGFSNAQVQPATWKERA